MGLLKRTLIELENSESDLTVMTWNTLADQLANDFPAVSPEHLTWEYRKNLLLEGITSYMPDVVCLQEVDHFSDFFQLELSERGYQGWFQKKSGWHNDGLCIFFNVEKIVKIEEICVMFPQRQFAIGALMECNGKRFALLTTHLKAKAEFDSVRVEQANILLERLRGIREIPIILCGDFNSLPGTNAYKVIKENDIGLSSVYGVQKELEYTTVKVRERLQIKTEDYIWQRGFAIKKLLSIPSLEEIGTTGLPNGNYPSDHISLLASFSFF